MKGPESVPLTPEAQRQAADALRPTEPPQQGSREARSVTPVASGAHDAVAALSVPRRQNMPSSIF